MTNPQGAVVTRDSVEAPIKLALWWNGIDTKAMPSVTLSQNAALNLAIDLLLAARQGMK